MRDEIVFKMLNLKESVINKIFFEIQANAVPSSRAATPAPSGDKPIEDQVCTA